MRALAAVAVVLQHARDLVVADYAGQRAWAPIFLGTGFGHQAVIVFFVLSGYWVGRNVLRDVARPAFWSRYLISRGSRLYIVFLPALLVGGALDWSGAAALAPAYYQANPSHSFTGLAPDSLSATTLLGNLLFLQTIVVPTFGSNGPLWSLACEFWFYIWFPALVLAARRRPSLALAALALAVIAPRLVGYFLIWLAGVAVYRVASADGAAPGKVHRGFTSRRALWMTSGLLAVALGVSRGVPGLPGDMLVGLAFATFLLALLRQPKRLWPAPRILVSYGARSSYSLYALHFPLIVFVAGVAGFERSAISPRTCLLTLLLIVAAVAAGWLFSRLTEAHTDGLRRRLLALAARR